MLAAQCFINGEPDHSWTFFR